MSARLDSVDTKVLSVPLAIKLLEKCSYHKISGEVIKRLHYTDLLLLIMRIDIKKMEEAIRAQDQSEGKKKLSAKEAISFLKGI